MKTHIENLHMSRHPKHDGQEQIRILETELCTKCNTCNFSGNEGEMKEHLQNKHRNKFPCIECGNVFQDQITLKKHIQSWHSVNSEPFPCELCGLVLADFHLLQEHVKTFHEEEYVNCRYCDSRVKDKEELKEHMIRYHEQTTILHTIATLVSDLHDNQEKNDIIQDNLFNLLRNVSERLDKIESKFLDIKAPVENIKPQKEGRDDEDHEVKHPKKEDKSKSKSLKHKITWVGTSLSKALDKNKVEKDLDVELSVKKAYCVKKEGRFPDENFETSVPQITKDGQIDTLVMEAGSIEITNIDVNKAMMNTDKDIEESKKEWFEQVEETSKSLFQIAEDCIARDSKMNVVIVKRPQRFDKASKDILGIKSKLSEYANKVYEQCALKSNNSNKIHIVDLKLGAQNGNYLKELIYGKQENPAYDGIHFSGCGGSRHFTYRAVNALKHIVRNRSPAKMFPSPPGCVGNKISAKLDSTEHTRCPQAQYQRAQLQKQRSNGANQRQHYESYADVVRKNGHTTRVGQKDIFSIPTKNRFDQLPRNSQGNW